jgi:hypothetical protein
VAIRGHASSFRFTPVNFDPSPHIRVFGLDQRDKRASLAIGIL